MVDRTALNLIGLVFVSLTLAVMLVASVLVHKTVAGGLTPDASLAQPAGRR